MKLKITGAQANIVGNTVEITAVVPEPASLTLLGLGALPLLFRRRRA
ncbi:MAG: PEP-CTERM sorting domain-containing protein [Verrucomicrobiaceae bacterium]|nr:MAG: PEP-CTERM sorting domain-containing protein [Verrucomicrobiaceae bacterium]